MTWVSQITSTVTHESPGLVVRYSVGMEGPESAPYFSEEWRVMRDGFPPVVLRTGNMRYADDGRQRTIRGPDESLSDYAERCLRVFEEGCGYSIASVYRMVSRAERRRRRVVR